MTLSSKIDLARAIFGTDREPTANVTRITGTATADSSDGTVTVQLEDGDVIEVGTIGSVSSGDTVTIHVQRGEAQVIASEGWGDAMQAAVDEATAIAEATGQHFWHDSNGAHVTEVTQEQWQQSQTGHNILVNSLGILLRKALNYIAAWTGSALSFYDGDGNSASNVTASFGSAGAQIGKVDESHLEMDYHSLRLIDKDGNTYLRVSDLRDQSGVADVSQSWVGTGSTSSFSLTYTATDTNYTVEVNGSAASATKTTSGFTLATAPAIGDQIVAEYSTRAELVAFTFGRRNQVKVGPYSFSEGVGHIASGTYSHAEGHSNEASGNASHAEGEGNLASGWASHAEGYHTKARNSYSHAQGLGTETSAIAQTVVGKYNNSWNPSAAFIVGNGTKSDEPSDAFTVDWSGNVEAAGSATVGDSLVIGDESAYHSIDNLDSLGGRFFTMHDANGAPVYTWYMSTSGNLARREYANGAWQAPRYYTPSFAPGDSVSMNGYVSTGYISSSRTETTVVIHIPNGMRGVTSAAVTGSVIVRQNNAYLYGSSASTAVNLSGFTKAVTVNAGGGFIRLSFTGSTQTSAVNNSPISVYFSTLTVTFS